MLCSQNKLSELAHFICFFSYFSSHTLLSYAMVLPVGKIFGAGLSQKTEVTS